MLLCARLKKQRKEGGGDDRQLLNEREKQRKTIGSVVRNLEAVAIN